MDDLSAAIGAFRASAELVSDIAAYAKKLGDRELGKLSVDFEVGFRKFLERNHRKYSKIKTLLTPGTPVPLESTFESPTLEVNGDDLDEDTFLALLETENFLVITGVGGSGKSVFLKHIHVRYYNEGRGRVPFLVELRNLPADKTLMDYLLQQLQAVIPNFTSDLFQYALQIGKFAFLFDGFDEIDFSARDDVAKQIVDLSYAYGDNLILVSSRPDDVFSGWSEFFVARMKGFSKSQVVSLIKKLKYDRDVKRDFLRLVRDGSLFETHGSYLSNPLLCNIMLLTFDQGAEVPTKMHLFFGQTFDVLFYRHDATKGTSFRRKFQTSLSIDDFRHVLAAFSTFSYADFGPSMKRGSALQAAKGALEYFRSQEKPEDFLLDLCSSLSLLVKEGETFSYIHRTFQEYFVAIFLGTQDLEDWDVIIENILVEKPNDSVISLLADINRDRFERDFLAPRVNEICSDLSAIDISKHPAEAFRLFYLAISIQSDGQRSWISSWTVGRNNVRPKWHHMSRFFDDASSRMLTRNFDWRSRVQLDMSDGGGAEVDEVTDDFILGTPLVDYLETLKSNALALQRSLAANATAQRRLLSAAIFNRRPGAK